MFAFIAVVIILSFVGIQPATRSFEAAFAEVFWGTGGSIWQYLTVFALWFGFLFAWQLREADSVGDLVDLEQLRYGHRRAWALHMLVRDANTSFAYVLGTLLFSCGAYWVLGGSDWGALHSLLLNTTRFLLVGVVLLVALLTFTRASRFRFASATGGLAAIGIAGAVALVSSGFADWDIANAWSVSLSSRSGALTASSVLVLVALGAASFLYLAGLLSGRPRKVHA